MTGHAEVAAELTSWFRRALEAYEQVFDSLASDERHRKAAIYGALQRNAHELVRSELADEGGLLTPTCLTLAGACLAVGIQPNQNNWRAAVENVVSLAPQVRRAEQAMGLLLGSPASIFKEQLNTSLENAGFGDRPTPLNEKSQQLALGLTINWALRFLLAYVLQTPASSHDESAFETLKQILQPLEDQSRR